MRKSIQAGALTMGFFLLASMGAGCTADLEKAADQAQQRAEAAASHADQSASRAELAATHADDATNRADAAAAKSDAILEKRMQK
jgi:hypothetical protein